MSEEFTRGLAHFGRFRSWAATHPGTVRTHNEDAYVNRPDLGLWAVADGVGGHRAGEVASAGVSRALNDLPAGLSAREALAEVRARLDATHRSLRAGAHGEHDSQAGLMATTVVVMLAQGDHFACLWAGDSRAYLLRAGTLTRISRDHSLMEELVESGALTAEQAARHPQSNVITRAIGAGPDDLDLDKRSGPLLAEDRLLLCSDGLCKALAETHIAALLGADEDAGAERLVLAALSARASDNITAVVVQVLPAAT